MYESGHWDIGWCVLGILAVAFIIYSEITQKPPPVETVECQVNTNRVAICCER